MNRLRTRWWVLATLFIVGNAAIGLERGISSTGQVVMAAVAQQAPPVTGEQLLAALNDLHGNKAEAAADRLVGALADPRIGDETWTALFATYFAVRPFTPALSEFWQYAYQQGDVTAQPSTARRSAACATQAFEYALPQAITGDETATGSLINAVAWLQLVAPSLTGADQATVGTMLSKVCAGQLAGLIPAAGLPRVQDLRSARLGVWLAWALRAYPTASAAEQPAMLGLQGAGAELSNATGILLLDNNVLDQAQVAALTGLAKAIPKDLHRVAIICVPEATGIDPGDLGYTASTQMIFVPAIPITAQTDPAEFHIIRNGPAASLFTVTAAQEFTRAIQATQFLRRPWLIARRDALLSRAGDNAKRYLRFSVPPQRYLTQPDELLPALAYLWFVNTETTFQQAFDLTQFNQRDGLDQFLLFADLMSGGGDSTATFLSDIQGNVFHRDAAIGRVGPVGQSAETGYVSAIQVGDANWSFGLDESGRVVRWNRP